MKFLITGSGGQLGTAFAECLSASPHQWSAPPRTNLDICNRAQVDAALEELQPDVVLNCAAYNHVDAAESNTSEALQVNAHAVQHLASACRQRRTLLVHFSSDYVFDGTQEALYTEKDTVNPINAYGMSKVRGEQALGVSRCDFLLFRLSWVFGKGKQNFFYKLNQWASKQPVLKIVFDEVSAPTYADDAAQIVLRAIEQRLRGTYHLTNGGYASRYEVARHFLLRQGYRSLILPVAASTFPSAAKRPYFSAMNNRLLSQELGVMIPGWRDAVDRYTRNTF